MPKITALLIFLIFTNKLQANSHLEPKPLFEHLIEINAQWAYHQHDIGDELISFESDNARIKKYLDLVIKKLRSDVPHWLSQTQLNKRRSLLDSLSEYSNQGIFPSNRFHLDRTPYFIDIYGVHCAVGHLLKVSGHEDLAQRISTEHNYDYIADIKTPGIEDWASEFGFEIDELKWIQPSYVDRTPLMPFAGGTNGEVTLLKDLWFNDNKILIVAGNFTKVGETSCNGLAYFVNGKWQCFNQKFTGKTNDVIRYDETLYFIGDYLLDDKQYPLVTFNQELGWNFPAKPKEEHLEATTLRMDWERMVLTYYLPKTKKTELWEKGDTSSFKQLLEINGRVNATLFHDLSGWDPGRNIYAGAFDSYLELRDSEVVACNNIFYDQGYYDSWFSPETNANYDTVFALVKFGYNTYFGCNCEVKSDYKDGTYCLSKLSGNTFSNIISYSQLKDSWNDEDSSSRKIKTITSNDASFMLFGGKFSVSDGMYTGYNVGTYEPLSGTLRPHGSLYGHVNQIGYFDDITIFAGKITGKGKFDLPLNNLVRYYEYQDAIHSPTQLKSIYPNPSTGILFINTTHLAAQKIEVFNATGSLVQQIAVNNSGEKLEINLSHLDKGLYFIKILDSENQYSISKIILE